MFKKILAAGLVLMLSTGGVSAVTYQETSRGGALGDAGSTAQKATGLGLHDPLQGFDIEGTVGQSGRDTYRFTMSSTFDLMFAATPRRANASGQDLRIVLTGTSGRKALNIVVPMAQFQTLIGNLSAGDYLLRVVGNGARVDYNFKVSAVPLPATLGLFATALLGAGLVSRRRKTAKA